MRRVSIVLFFACLAIVCSSTGIDLNDLFNYQNQAIPNYINDDNTDGNSITDEAATLGRVLFYDKNLSTNNSVACASCHQQQFGFSDPQTTSLGVNGLTGRHSMRLVNSRFSNETAFFWDERAATLEIQTTQPIQDHAEMGFSGTDGDPGFAELITKMEAISYYEELFQLAFGSTEITEARMQMALAQFIRSIQSFDSKYDVGRAQVGNINQLFPNFTADENAGKTLFQTPPPQGGAGCQTCHSQPEFDIDPNSRNNGIVGVINDPSSIDVNVTRAPSLRDMFNPDGLLNGPLMHTGEFNTLRQVIDHYDDIDIVPGNNNLDNRLRGGPGGNGQNLNLTELEKNQLEVFLLTLTGSDMYTNEKWSDPFEIDGSLNLTELGTLPVELLSFEGIANDKWNTLDWRTASEEEFSHFELERSADGRNGWFVVAEVLAADVVAERSRSTGAGEVETSYASTDDQPLAENYYRLRMVDLDGSFAFSEVIYLYNPGAVSAGLELNVYPNPNYGNFSFQTPGIDELPTAWSLFDLTGRKVWSGKQTTEVTAANLNSGVYILVVDVDGQRLTERVVVR
jgi:cytochrome c peroxidase